MASVKSAISTWTQSLAHSLYEAIRRGKDISRNVVLTPTLTPLFAEKCVYVTIINTTGDNIEVSINNTQSVTLPNKAGITIDVIRTEEISVSGTGTLDYVVSK